MSLQLVDNEDKVVLDDAKSAAETSVTFRIHAKSPHKWSAETPYLYHMVINIDGNSVAHRIGFRRLEIKDGIFLANGKRIVFRGVNRHEHNPLCGRAVPYDFLKEDLLLMKSHNINAIRTSHQPNDPRLYDLANELGLWIIDEADLECHGFGEVEEAALLEEQKRLNYEERKAITYRQAA